MKKLFAATLLAVTAAASAQVSVTVGQPGFYGRIDIGGFAPPPVLYTQPVIVERRVRTIEQQPLYLRVPPGHARNWAKHCRRYNACAQPVLFVQDRWYTNEYAPRVRAGRPVNRGSQGVYQRGGSPQGDSSQGGYRQDGSAQGGYRQDGSPRGGFPQGGTPRRDVPGSEWRDERRDGHDDGHGKEQGKERGKGHGKGHGKGDDKGDDKGHGNGHGKHD